MEKLGIEVQSNTLGDLPYVHNKCYTWYDGPRIWETVDIEGRPLLVYWVEDDNPSAPCTERNMIIPTSHQLLREMLGGKITICDFVRESSSFLYIQDIYHERDRPSVSTLYKLDLKDLPKEYLPEEGVYLPECG